MSVQNYSDAEAGEQAWEPLHPKFRHLSAGAQTEGHRGGKQGENHANPPYHCITRKFMMPTP